jgi:hypothetical protein
MAKREEYERGYGKEYGAVEHEQYCMPSGYKKVTVDMNREAEYPAWNNAADHQAKYPDAKMEGAKRNMQPMGSID